MQRTAIWLNVDLGERPDEPLALYAAAHVANIACGGHAGDAQSMRRALEACAAHDCIPGAHPSFPDRAGFGRRPMALPLMELQISLQQQIQTLAELAAQRGQVLPWVKPHGALYHAVDAQPELASALVDVVDSVLGRASGLIGPAGGALQSAVQERGLGYAVEAFADRGRVRTVDGRWQLIPRAEPGAVLSEPAAVAAQVREILAENACRTLCVHGDQPRAVAVAAQVRALLDAHAAEHAG